MVNIIGKEDETQPCDWWHGCKNPSTSVDDRNQCLGFVFPKPHQRTQRSEGNAKHLNKEKKKKQRQQKRIHKFKWSNLIMQKQINLPGLHLLRGLVKCNPMWIPILEHPPKEVPIYAIRNQQKPILPPRNNWTLLRLNSYFLMQSKTKTIELLLRLMISPPSPTAWNLWFWEMFLCVNWVSAK